MSLGKVLFLISGKPLVQITRPDFSGCNRVRSEPGAATQDDPALQTPPPGSNLTLSIPEKPRLGIRTRGPL